MAKMALIVPLRKLSLFEFDFCFSCAEQSSVRLSVLIRITTLQSPRAETAEEDEDNHRSGCVQFQLQGFYRPGLFFTAFSTA
jgi:hypothetical protein